MPTSGVMQGESGAASVGRSRAWNVGLWVAQAALALAFGMAGLMKLTTPMAELVASMGWAAAVPEALVRFIGAAELAGAVGLLLPAATRILPVLTPAAATGLATVMALAGITHLSRGELGALPVNLVLGGIAVLVAWGRSRKAPIAPRG